MASKTFCPTPWLELYIKPNGDVYPCCDIPKKPETVCGNINKDKFIDIVNHPVYKEIRQSMLAGEKHSHCDNCWKREDLSGKSLRTKRNTPEYMRLMDPKFSEENAQDTVEHIKAMKIDFSNGCNLKCPMCGPERSTAWIKDKLAFEKDFKHFGDDIPEYRYLRFKRTPEQWDSIKTTIPISFIDDNLEFLLGMNMFDISGGEPFFHPQFLYLVDKLYENNWQGRLKVITNLTLLTPEIVEKLAFFDTSLSISCDGYGDLYEYVRPSIVHGKYKWSDMEKSVQMLSGTHIKDYYIRHSFSYTPQLLNFYNIIPWLEFTKANPELYSNRLQILNEPLIWPLHLCLAVHPDKDEKQRLIDDLQPYEDIYGVTSIQKHLTAEVPDTTWANFCHFINFLDKQRKTSIMKYIPQFEKYWIYE